jgi:hypothetical protein
LHEIVRDHRLGELVFSQDLAFEEINAWMSRLGPSIAYRVSSSGSGQIVGSDSRKEQGKLYTAKVEFALAYPVSRRLKRLVDVITGVLVLISWPVVWMTGQGTPQGWRNLLGVLAGRKTWVGYRRSDPRLGELPPLCDGVLATGMDLPHDPAEIHLINYIYAREYRVWKDLDLIVKNIGSLISGTEQTNA